MTEGAFLQDAQLQVPICHGPRCRVLTSDCGFDDSASEVKATHVSTSALVEVLRLPQRGAPCSERHSKSVRVHVQASGKTRDRRGCPRCCECR
jgi:hypothetical protein